MGRAPLDGGDEVVEDGGHPGGLVPHPDEVVPNHPLRGAESVPRQPRRVCRPDSE